MRFLPLALLSLALVLAGCGGSGGSSATLPAALPPAPPPPPPSKLAGIWSTPHEYGEQTFEFDAGGQLVQAPDAIPPGTRFEEDTPGIFAATMADGRRAYVVMHPDSAGLLLIFNTDGDGAVLVRGPRGDPAPAVDVARLEDSFWTGLEIRVAADRTPIAVTSMLLHIERTRAYTISYGDGRPPVKATQNRRPFSARDPVDSRLFFLDYDLGEDVHSVHLYPSADEREMVASESSRNEDGGAFWLLVREASDG